MKGRTPEDSNELLTRLYALTQEQPIEHFQNAALVLLKAVVPFDAAIWGSATVAPGGIDIHSFHLHNKTPDMVADYEEVKHLDSASSRMFNKSKATQAFDTNSFFDARQKRPIRDFMVKFEQPHFLLTTDVKAKTNNESSLLHWITLYRAKQNAQYNPSDVKWLQLFSPHLKQALALNWSAHLSQAAVKMIGAGAASKPCYASGIADLKGNVYGHDFNFMALVSKACGEDYVHSSVLPIGLTTALALGKPSFVWQQMVVNCHAEHGLVILRMRGQTRADSLTTREKEIAMLVTKGRTYKQVAAELGNAPNTVRNQLQTIYNKLQVNNVAELIRAMPDEE